MDEFVKTRSFSNGNFHPNWYISYEFQRFLFGVYYEIKNNAITVNDGILFDILTSQSLGGKWKIKNIFIKPQFTPEECYFRGLTYNAAIYGEIFDPENNEFRPKLTELFLLPVMVGTFDMFHDPLPGNQCCHFIINGLNIALIHIEKHALHTPLLRWRDSMSECYVKNTQSSYFSVAKTKTKGIIVKIKMETFLWPEILFLLGKENENIIKYFASLYDIPIQFDMEIDEDSIITKILKLLRYDPLLTREKYSIEELRIVFIEEMLLSFLPIKSVVQKLRYLFECVSKCLLLYQGKIQETNLDNIRFKRYLTATEHVKGMLIRIWDKFAASVDTIDNSFRKKREQLTKTLRKPFNDPSSEFAFQTASPVRLMKEGTSRMNAVTLFRSYLLKIHPENMDMTIRIWNGASSGFVDPIATPEGKQVGLVNHLTFTCEISYYIKEEAILEKIKTLIDIDNVHGSQVYLNNIALGCMINDINITLKELKQVKLLYFPNISIVKEDNHIFILSDSGRALRPLKRLHDSSLEWIDSREQEYICICQVNETPKDYHTHQVLNDCDTISIQAASLPFIHHDKAARNLISSVMMGQAIGFQLPQNRYNTEPRYHLVSAQPKINETDVGKLIGLPESPVSTNVSIVITALADNVDDAIVVNKSFIERGGFLVQSSQWYRFTLPKAHKFGKPAVRPPQINLKEWNKVGNNGIIYWKPGFHPIVTNETPMAILLNSDNKISQVFRLNITTNTKGIVETDYIYRVTDIKHSEDEFSNPFLFIQVTHLRPAQVGDKLTSLSGQKGVIGKMINQEDLPFSMQTGCTPDIFVNPHGIFSRCTVGQLIDMIASVGVLLSDKLKCNSSPFANITKVEEIQHVMKQQAGLNGGYEVFIDGKSGKQITCMQYTGIVPYAKLVHFASDKCSASNYPRIDFETKAPVKGRKHSGGVRFGEMEYTVAGSHGAASFIHEKLGSLSDHVTVKMCPKCSLIVQSIHDRCPQCYCVTDDCFVPFATLTLKRRMLCANMDFNIKQSKFSQ